MATITAIQCNSTRLAASLDEIQFLDELDETGLEIEIQCLDVLDSMATLLTRRTWQNSIPQ